MGHRTRTTAAVRAGIDTDPAQGAVVPPVYLSTNYSFKGLREPRTFDYSRAGNPTRSTLAGASLAWRIRSAGTLGASNGSRPLTAR